MFALCCSNLFYFGCDPVDLEIFAQTAIIKQTNQSKPFLIKYFLASHEPELVFKNNSYWLTKHCLVNSNLTVNANNCSFQMLCLISANLHITAIWNLMLTFTTN